MDYTGIVITAIVSPLMLKIIEYVLNKSSKQSETMKAKIEGLSARVDELKEKNIRQEIEINILRSQIQDRDKEMLERDKLIAELRVELDELRKAKRKA